ncbi:aspartic peptidase domain-containing protein [Plectosphaerella plurivora]|uniref:Aspartic peptidase domain-containing protein n=1 Tax=Plectosphaerella plurivora TaxID=936078 RepID=A0A9P8V7K7_9PEZI|nr:aspartic peptidase domain-containing protein [Plectosphaerella plurivora]
MRLNGCIPAITILALSITITTQQTIETSWSSNNMGSDGPWQGVEVTVGDDQTMTLYPGTIFYSWLIPPDYCDFNRTLGCPAGSNGLYNKEKSFNQFTGSTGGIQFSPPASDMSRGIDIQGPPATSWVDQMTIASSVNVPNVSVAILNKPGVAYPDGKWYPLSAGCLGLGGFGSVNQTFGLTGGSSINASLIPGHLWESGRVSSNSFGMHFGSAVSGSSVAGSLQWGGYDKSRVLGDVLTTHNSDGELFARARLTGLSLEVADGVSPFNASEATEDNLLGSNNQVDVDLDGCSPYLTFSKATCDRIAEHLPVTYDQDLGLYLWDTSSPQYPRVVSSASSLAFTIESPKPEGDKDTITVRVPFAHLNLTLSAPLKSTPTPYFPCFTGGRAGADAAVLGRAFLQDAFLGANWATKTWWLAQAPGPRLGNRDVEEIAQSDVTISGSDQAWAESWRGTWTPLEEGVEPTGPLSSPQPPPSTSAEPEPEPESSGLPTGAIAGIGVGAGVLVLAAIGGLVFFFLRRRRKAKAAELHAVPAPAPETELSHWGYGGYNTQHGYAEKEVYKPQTEPAEMYTGGEHQPGYTRQELP